MTTHSSSALTVAQPGNALDNARAWAAYSAEERRRRAASAAAAHDIAALLALTDAYLTLHGRAGARVSAHTRRVYATSIRILIAAWRQENLLHPARDAGATWLRGLEAEGAWRKDGTVGPASPATLRVRLAGGRMLYRALRWTGATTADPFADVRAAPETTEPWDKRQPYSQEQLEALLAVAGVKDRVLLLLGAHGGLRISEMCTLQWSDVDRASATVLVRAGKGGKRRQVIASATLLAALDALPVSAGTVFSLTDSGVRKRMRVLCKRAGVPYLGMHALRHAAGTRLVREGGSLEDAARHLGHASIATTRVYAKWSDDQLKRRVGDW